MTIGFFNWGDAVQATALDVTQLGLEPQRIALHDFWTGKAQPHTGCMVAAALPARSHLMWDVIRK